MGVIRHVGLPTRWRDWQLMGRTVKLVLRLPRYAGLAILYSVSTLTIFVFARNLTILQRVILFGNLGLEPRLRVLAGMYPGVGSAYTAVQSGLLVATAVLIGVNLALLTYHVRKHRVSLQEGSGSLGGVVLGTLGAGCAACGSAVLAGVLSAVGAGGLITLLPLDGLEFALIALLVVLLSVYWLADGMRGGEIAGCPVEPART